jgi:hypothetical protein
MSLKPGVATENSAESLSFHGSDIRWVYDDVSMWYIE